MARVYGHMMTIVDASLAGCLFVVPFLMAGRHPLGQAVLVALSVTAAAAWAAGQALRAPAPFRPTWLAPLLLLAVAAPAFQLVPLPEPLLDAISPKIAQLLPMWRSQAQPATRLAAWQTVSLTPAATRDGLVLLSAYVLLFFVTVQRAERIEDVQRLLRWCAAAAAITGIYGLVQLVTSNGKFFWFYEHPYGTTLGAAKANFTTRNHFAEFLALGLGPLLWWVQSAFRNDATSPRTRVRSSAFRRFPAQQPPKGGTTNGALAVAGSIKPYVLALSLGLVLFAGLLSLSRGGMVAMALAMGLTTALCWRAWTGSKAVVALLAGIAVLVTLLLNVFGLEGVNRRIDDFRAGSLEQLDRAKSRRSIWTAAIRGIREFSLLGAGVGSHCETYPIYYSPGLYEEAADREFTHAENSYLQVGLETGLAGLAPLAGVMACCGVWCVGGLIRARSARVVACLGAVTASFAATAVHAVVDFIWYVPACVVMIVVLAACAARLWRLGAANGTQSRSQRSAPSVRHSGLGTRRSWMLPRLAYLAAVAVLVPLGAWMIKGQAQAAMAELDWDAYRKSRIAAERSPASKTSEVSETSEVCCNPQEAELRRVDLLRSVVHWQPDHARAHLELAQCYLRLFDIVQAQSENPMSLGNVRDAALRSRFPSREALDAWLERAVGKHARYLDLALRHSRRALALCPLQGRGYLYLAELCFLENAGEEWKGACIEQALRVRPFDGDVLYSAAAEAFLAGDGERWLELARRSFHSGRRYQRRWIDDLIGRTPPEAMEETIQAVVVAFRPDLEALRGLCASAQGRGRPEQLAWLQRYCAERAEAEAKSSRGEAAARLWTEAQKRYATIGDAVRAEQCARNAAASDPQSFEARYGLGLVLLAGGRPAEAEPHLRWCRERRPNDPRVDAKWREALKGRLDAQPATATRRADSQHSPLPSNGRGEATLSTRVASERPR